MQLFSWKTLAQINPLTSNTQKRPSRGSLYPFILIEMTVKNSTKPKCKKNVKKIQFLVSGCLLYFNFDNPAFRVISQSCPYRFHYVLYSKVVPFCFASYILVNSHCSRGQTIFSKPIPWHSEWSWLQDVYPIRAHWRLLESRSRRMGCKGGWAT